MGDKVNNKSKHGKKLTTKEKKAMNHLKLMEGAKDKTSNIASNVNTPNINKDKKAA